MTIHHEKAHEGVVLDPRVTEDFKLIEAIDVGIFLAKSSGDWVGQPAEDHNGEYLSRRTEAGVALRGIQQGAENLGMTPEAQALPLENRIHLAEAHGTTLFIHEDEVEPLVDSLVIASDIANRKPDLAITKVYDLDAARQALEQSETQFAAAA